MATANENQNPESEETATAQETNEGPEIKNPIVGNQPANGEGEQPNGEGEQPTDGGGEQEPPKLSMFETMKLERQELHDTAEKLLFEMATHTGEGRIIPDPDVALFFAERLDWNHHKVVSQVGRARNVLRHKKEKRSRADLEKAIEDRNRLHKKVDKKLAPLVKELNELRGKIEELEEEKKGEDGKIERINRTRETLRTLVSDNTKKEYDARMVFIQSNYASEVYRLREDRRSINEVLNASNRFEDVVKHRFAKLEDDDPLREQADEARSGRPTFTRDAWELYRKRRAKELAELEPKIAEAEAKLEEKKAEAEAMLDTYAEHIPMIDD